MHHAYDEICMSFQGQDLHNSFISYIPYLHVSSGIAIFFILSE